MTNDREWQAPGQSRVDSGVQAPTPPVTPTPNGQYQAGQYQGQPGWTPPPKPGLIPLRPLDLGTILGASFRVLRRNPRPTFGAALLIQGSVQLLLLLVVGGVSFAAFGRIATSTSQNTDEITAGAYGIVVLAAIIPGLLAVVASALLQGIIVLEVSRGTVGEKLTFRQLWSRARGRLGALVGWSALLMLAVTIVVGILVAVIVLLIVSLGSAGIVLAVFVGLFGGLGVLVLFVWLSTKLALVPSAIMIERMTIRHAFARSWMLTDRFFWRTFGILALVAVIIWVVSQVISFPLSFLGPMVTLLVDPQSQNQGAAIVVVAIVAVLAVVIVVMFQAITSVIQSATTALVYIDLRIRKEGLDLELARYVETRQSGATPDPFPHASAARESAREPSNESPWG